MHRSSLATGAEALLSAAANAGQKGLAQWFTPDDLARDCARLLPRHRPGVCDLTCGRGTLLRAVAHGHREFTAGLGFDLDPEAVAAATETTRHRVTVAELTEAAALLAEVGWQCDLFALNPPWDLHLFRERLAFLEESDLGAVREAFAAHDGRTPRECLDSTVATLCIALDRCSRYGEGFLLGYADTVERLILGPEAPHGALAAHIWAHARIPGEHMGIAGAVTCLWFAREHRSGPTDVAPEFLAVITDPKADRQALATLRRRRYGQEIHQDGGTLDRNFPLWVAVTDELVSRRKAAAERPFHLWLNPNGTIGTALTRFERASSRTDVGKVARLAKLEGQRPLQLVVQREARDLLRGVTSQDGWRVSPELAAAVEAALRTFHQDRAPLAPLNAIQRLGYLDEEDAIECRKNLTVHLGGSGAPPVVTFRAGQRYPLRSQTITVTRVASVPDLSGAMQQIEYEGSQLALFAMVDGHEVCFLDQSLREGHKLNQGKTTVDATLQELADHFVIPEVPDIATLLPERHALMLARLNQLVADVASLTVNFRN